MPKLSAGHRRALQKGVAKYIAGLPLNRLAKAMRVDPQTLRARFASRGFKVRGASLGALVGALTEKERAQHSARIRKLMQRTDDTAPEAARPLPTVRSSDHTQEGSGALVPDVRLALIGLYRAARALGPLRPDQQTEVSLGVAEAILALRGTLKFKHSAK